MKKQVVIWVCAVLGSAGLVLAQDGGQRPEGGRGGGGMGWGGMSPAGGEGLRVDMMIERIINNPDLVEKAGITDEQIKILTSAISEMKKERVKIQAELELASLDQADKLAQDTVDEKAIMKAIEKTGELQTQLAKLAVKQMLLVKKTLTPDQIKKIKELAREMRRNRMNEAQDNKKQDRKERRHEKSGETAGTDTGSNKDDQTEQK